MNTVGFSPVLNSLMTLLPEVNISSCYTYVIFITLEYTTRF